MSIRLFIYLISITTLGHKRLSNAVKIEIQVLKCMPSLYTVLPVQWVSGMSAIIASFSEIFPINCLEYVKGTAVGIASLK